MTATVYADPVTLWARTLRRVVRRPDGCWEFTGSVTSRGYGSIGSGRKGRTILTHQLAVIARDGSLPDGMTVDHSCHDSLTCTDNATCPHKRCVNPDHLVVMTSGDNTRRRWESGLCTSGHELAWRTRADGKARYCPTCQRAYAATWRANHKARTP
jgi:hypothetical protein